MKGNLILAALVFLSIHSFAQYVYIPDANFRACLKETYSFAFTNSDLLILQEVPNIKLIDCANRAIGDLTGIQYFVNLEGLRVDYNPITTIPSLSGLSELVSFTCGHTRITTLPDISGCSKLLIIFANDNALGTFPDFDTNLELRSIDVQNNNIPDVPDLSFLPGLEYLNVGGNPVTSLPNLSPNKKLKTLMLGKLRITEAPNLSALRDLETLNINDNNITTFPAVNSTNLRVVVAYNTDISDLPDFSNTLLGMPGSQMALFGNKLTFEDLLPFVNGEFTTLQMSPQKQPDPDRLLFAPLHQTYTIKLPFDDDVTSSAYEWYKDGLLLTTTTANSLVMEDVDYDDAGIYRARITNPNIPGLTIESGAVTLTVVDCEYCNYPIISPDSDGVSDDYYISCQGTIKVYNREGILVNQFSGPATWNGTDNSGSLLGTGLYILLCNDQTEIAITIIR